NLRAGHFAILIGNDDRGLEPWIAPVPAFELVLVGGERHGGAELVVLLALPRGRERIHDAPFDAVEIEVLLAHEVEIARRQAAAGRPGVAPRGERLALGIRKAFDVAVALTLAVRLQIVPPAIAEIRPQILKRALGMDIAVEDTDARLAAVLGAAHGLPDLDIHREPSFRETADHRSQASGFYGVMRREFLPAWFHRRRTASAENPRRRAV